MLGHRKPTPDPKQTSNPTSEQNPNPTPKPKPKPRPRPKSRPKPKQKPTLTRPSSNLIIKPTAAIHGMRQLAGMATATPCGNLLYTAGRVLPAKKEDRNDPHASGRAANDAAKSIPAATSPRRTIITSTRHFRTRYAYSLRTGITRGAAELQILPRKNDPHTYGYAGGGIFN